MWLTLFFLGTAALFLAMTSSTLFHLQWARRLPALSELGTADPYDIANDSRIQCSVIVAARDEESRIEDTVRHLLTQRGVRLEVIVVDDRLVGDLVRLHVPRICSFEHNAGTRLVNGRDNGE